MGVVMMVAMGQQSHYRDTLRQKPIVVKSAESTKKQPRLAGKGSHECAAPAVEIPGLSQARPTPGIGDRDCWHRVSDSGKRWVKSHLVATGVIVFAERA